MQLTSPAFGDGERIPSRHTCDGDDVSPPLEWTAPPEGSAVLALCLDDPDAGRYPFTHCAEGVAAPAEGRNDFGAPGYRGPCPPPGKPHRYRFTLYALDAEPALGPSDRRLSFEEAIRDHVLATAQLTGTYGR
jgi:phosphatidylethanolamine-binding protein (PEBP) family uncharacterized protein